MRCPAARPLSLSVLGSSSLVSARLFRTDLFFRDLAPASTGLVLANHPACDRRFEQQATRCKGRKRLRGNALDHQAWQSGEGPSAAGVKAVRVCTKIWGPHGASATTLHGGPHRELPPERKSPMATILQISDLHLLSQPQGTLKGVPTSASLALVLQRARDAYPDPDCIVLTGDLSHEETVAGYELLKWHLGDWGERCLLIPGNHDNRTGLREVFRQVPGMSDEPIWFQSELGDWLLLGLDTHVPGEVYGELSAQSLNRLETALTENGGRPALVFMHHHPGPVGSTWLDKIGLQNAPLLEALLPRHAGVRGLFCGHIHQVFEGQLAGVPFYSAPATAIQFLPGSETVQFDLQPPGFRVIELDGDQFSTATVRLDHMPFTPLHDEVTIKLDQFLKLTGAVDTGGQAKLLIQGGEVRVNDEVETRRGRKLKPGDVVELDGESFAVDSA